MSVPVAGDPEVDVVRPGVHLCALYSGPDERDRVLLPFIREGLRGGDECVCIVDGLEPSSVRRRAHEAADAPRGGRLGVYPASDVCSRRGELSVGQVTDLFASILASSGADGPPVVRAAAEMPWWRPGTQELSRYESAVREVLAELPVVFLCLHDLRRIGAGMLTDVLRIHSAVLLDGTVLHQQPRPAAGTRARYPLARLPGPRGEGEGKWLSLTGAEVRVAELVARGMTNRAMAEVLTVSPHTVDAHLKHIYVKLEIHSRVDLTVLALRYS